MEIFVLKFLPDVLSKYPECCNCPQCIEDITSYALNRLPVKYFTSDAGRYYTSLFIDDPKNVDMIKERIEEGIKLVLKDVRHHSSFHENS